MARAHALDEQPRPDLGAMWMGRAWTTWMLVPSAVAVAPSEKATTLWAARLDPGEAKPHLQSRGGGGDALYPLPASLALPTRTRLPSPQRTNERPAASPPRRITAGNRAGCQSWSGKSSAVE